MSAKLDSVLRDIEEIQQIGRTNSEMGSAATISPRRLPQTKVILREAPVE